jgi:hypothetical protein
VLAQLHPKTSGGDSDLRRKGFIKPLVENGRAGEVEFLSSGPDLGLSGTIETHVRTVSEYLWHLGSRPKCFFFKQSALILRKSVSIIRKRITLMFRLKGPPVGREGTKRET